MGGAELAFRPMTANDPGSRFGFLMIPNFSLSAFAAGIEALRLANHVSGEQLYEWCTISIDGTPVIASSGIEVRADYAIADVERIPTVFVCA